MKNFDDDHGQLLMLAGITITISILSLAVVSIGLSSITSPSEKDSFIKYEFDNVRKEFGVALEERLVDLSQYEDATIEEYILDTEDIFAFTENLDGYYFDVTYDASNFVIEKGNDKIGIKINLFLTDGVESVYEGGVEYFI